MAQTRRLLRRLFVLLLWWTTPAQSIPANEQTAWQRARTDTSSWANSAPILFGAITAAGGGALGALATSLISNAPILVEVVAGIVGAVTGFLLIVLAIAGVFWVLAPHRQRDEARTQVTRLHAPTKEIVPTTPLGEAIDLSLMQAEAIEQERSFLSDEDLLKRVRRWKSETVSALTEAKKLQESLLGGSEFSTADDALSFLREKATLLKDALMQLDRESEQAIYL